jgi:hypothetical protein
MGYRGVLKDGLFAQSLFPVELGDDKPTEMLAVFGQLKHRNTNTRSRALAYRLGFTVQEQIRRDRLGLDGRLVVEQEKKKRRGVVEEDSASTIECHPFRHRPTRLVA